LGVSCNRLLDGARLVARTHQERGEVE
jgi:hypothetical protein